MNLLGIARSPRFSPNSVARDEAIFKAVCEKLTTAGHHVTYYNEDNLPTSLEADGIFTMGRHRSTIDAIAKRPCINTSEGLAKCVVRSTLDEAMRMEHIPLPQNQHIDLTNNSKDSTPPCFPLWVKRATGYSEGKDDVAFATNEEELQPILQRFATNGCKSVLLSQHLKGDLVKFYGVAGTDFFRYTYPTDKGGFSKFGWEAQNGMPEHFAFDAHEMQAKLNAFAEHIGVPIYGGDAIVNENGQWHIIDFNDWPSFSAYCEEAAEAIAQRIIQELSSKI